MNVFAMLVVCLIFAAIPALIILFVVHKTRSEQIIGTSNEMKRIEQLGAEGSAPHMFAKLPTFILAILLVVGGFCVLSGFSQPGEGSATSAKAVIWGSLVSLIAALGLFIKYRTAYRAYKSTRLSSDQQK